MLKLIKILSFALLYCALAQKANADGEFNEYEFKLVLENVVQILQPYVDECVVGAERKHIEELILNEANPEYPTKCLRFCLMRQFGMMTDDESPKIKTEKLVEKLSYVMPGKEEELTEIIEYCIERNEEEDHCEAVHEGSMCLLEQLEEHGFALPIVET